MCYEEYSEYTSVYELLDRRTHARPNSKTWLHLFANTTRWQAKSTGYTFAGGANLAQAQITERVSAACFHVINPIDQNQTFGWSRGDRVETTDLPRAA